MLKIRQAVIVEGRYDKSHLSSLIDATIITTDGFDVFRDREKLNLIRTLAEKNGIVILTDSDAAGFKIRSYISGAVPSERITHVYIPDVYGKERRKTQPSAEGKLGVEGISAETLLEAFIKAGIRPDSSEGKIENRNPVTAADLVEWGISGGENSRQRRLKLLQTLNLPARMGTKALLQTLNTLYTREACAELIQKL